jgi:hypothetical protein
MELQGRLRNINTRFFKDLSEKTRKKFVDAYLCEMNCYKTSKKIEKADACANTCRNQSYKIRELLENQYSSSFVTYKQSQLSEELKVCHIDNVCARKALDNYQNKLSMILKQVDE